MKMNLLQHPIIPIYLHIFTYSNEVYCYILHMFIYSVIEKYVSVIENEEMVRVNYDKVGKPVRSS